jgi:phosphate transport system substrate-binding protein
VSPSLETVKNGKYAPLSRPIFIYASTKSIQRPEVDAFVKFYLKNAATLTKEVGYIPLPAEAYTVVANHYNARKTGSMFMGKDTVGLTIQQVIAAEK